MIDENGLRCSNPERTNSTLPPAAADLLKIDETVETALSAKMVTLQGISLTPEELEVQAAVLDRQITRLVQARDELLSSAGRMRNNRGRYRHTNR